MRHDEEALIRIARDLDERHLSGVVHIFVVDRHDERPLLLRVPLNELEVHQLKAMPFRTEVQDLLSLQVLEALLLGVSVRQVFFLGICLDGK